MFEIKHLKTLAALAKTGNLRKAADALFSSQSALSHQIKELENRLNASLFIRNSSPIVFTETGNLLLNLANEVLPRIDETNKQLRSPSHTQQTLRLAVACHACFSWLLPVINHFSPDNSIESFTNKSLFTIEFIDEDFSLSGNINRNKIKLAQPEDILFTDEKYNEPGFIYHEIGQFEVVAVSSKQRPLIIPTTYLRAEDFQEMTLLTYPLPTTELDVFKLFLTPAEVTPAQVKPVNNSHIMLQMAAANMGIATLPDWLVSSQTQQSLLQSYRLGEHGIFKTLYARYQQKNEKVAAIEQLIPQAVQAFLQLYHKQY